MQQNDIEYLIRAFDKNVIFSKTDLKGIITHASKAFVILADILLEN